MVVYAHPKVKQSQELRMPKHKIDYTKKAIYWMQISFQVYIFIRMQIQQWMYWMQI